MSMRVITFAHQKGGVGKSTLTLNLAYAFQGAGYRILVLDYDPQGSLISNAVLFPDIPVEVYQGEASLRRKDIDVILVDTPPYLASQLPEVFRYSDLVIVPTKTAVFDARAIRRTVEMIVTAKQRKPTLKAGIVRTHVSASEKDLLSETFTDLPVTLLKTQIHRRVSYSRSPLTRGVFNTKDTEAQREILELVRELGTL